MSSRPQRVVLTGGAGFIGSHVSEALLRRGVQLWILDNLDEFYPPAWKKANLEDMRRVGSYEFSQVDICDIVRLRETLDRARPDVVIHLAARAGVRPSIEQPHLYEQVNVAGTLNLLEMCRQLAVRKFLFGSSSSVYGATSRVPFSENQVELRPISVYAATKLAGEMLCYTWVDDIAAGVMAAVDYEPRPVGGVPFEVFNLGNSHPVKLAEMVELLGRI